MAITLVALAALAGCSSDSEESRQDSSPADPAPAKSTVKEPGNFNLTSTAFAQGKPIPKKYTADGANVSPSLSWAGLPKGTVELALICDDPDAPRKDPWVHWVLYKIPSGATGLPEDYARKAASKKPPVKAIEGINSFKKTGYGGPAPPRGHGRHRYYFKLVALDSKLKTEPGWNKTALLKATKGHLLGEATLMGTYER